MFIKLQIWVALEKFGNRCRMPFVPQLTYNGFQLLIAKIILHPEPKIFQMFVLEPKHLQMPGAVV